MVDAVVERERTLETGFGEIEDVERGCGRCWKGAAKAHREIGLRGMGTEYRKAFELLKERLFGTTLDSKSYAGYGIGVRHGLLQQIVAFEDIYPSDSIVACGLIVDFIIIGEDLAGIVHVEILVEQ